MKKKFPKLSVVLLSGMMSLPMLGHSTEPTPSQEKTTTPIAIQKNDIDAKVEALLKTLSLEEKVGQMAQITLDVITEGPNQYQSNEPVVLDKKLLEKAFKKYKVGSVLNTANNRARTPEKWLELISEMQKISMKEIKIPMLYGIDAIHGATYTAGATFFPQQIGMAATWNPELVKAGGAITAYETRASSTPWAFSPVLDIARNPEWPRMWETYGEDVYLASVMGTAIIDGMEGANNDLTDQTKVASCIKHFPAYGAEHSGKDRTPTWIPEIMLREYYLPSYKAAIDAGAHTIMINSGIINGVPVHANPVLLTELLRNELNFKGLVVTDWADIENIYNRDKAAESMKEAVKKSVNAGIDMSMIPYNFHFCDYLIELVKEGEVSEERVDDAVRKVLKLKYELGLFKTPFPKLKNYPDFASEKHEAEALKAASESITLLKNENNILPLKKGTKVLVTGPNANSMRTLNGGWSYSWQGEKVHEFAQEYNTILEAIQAKAGDDKVVYEAGVSYNNEGKYWEEKDINIEAAVAKAKEVEVIFLCLGENTYTEKPGDLDNLFISKNQENLALALAATGKPVVLILNEGRPRLISNFESKMSAVLQMYFPGNFGGDALANILYGETNPSGKLPYTYPMYPNSLITYDHKPSESQEEMEGVYDYASDVTMQYPFGFGLSYTTFKYTGLKVSADKFSHDDVLEVSVKVKNTGKRAGKEVVQLYTKDYLASVTPDNMRLRRFKKIELAPGEEQVVTFQLPARALAFIDADLKWTVEKGQYAIMVGGKTVDVEMTDTFKY